MKKNTNGTWNDAILKNKSLVIETKKKHYGYEQCGLWFNKSW
jgi:hypothetical protein